MYRVTWTDGKTGEAKKLDLHSIRSVDAVVNAYRQAPHQYQDVHVSERRIGWHRELVIVIDNR